MKTRSKSLRFSSGLHGMAWAANSGQGLADATTRKVAMLSLETGSVECGFTHNQARKLVAGHGVLESWGLGVG